MDNGFKYEEQASVCTEDSYPYTAKNGICKASGCTVGIPAHGVKSYVDVKADDEQSLMDAVAKQPVSVAIEADQMAFQLYKSGVLTKTCGTKLDHGVLVVGYGTEDGTDYWLVGSLSKHSLETQTFGFPKTFGKVVGKLNHEASGSKQFCPQLAAASVNLDVFHAFCRVDECRCFFFA